MRTAIPACEKRFFFVSRIQEERSEIEKKKSNNGIEMVLREGSTL
jgi:hypothetical protein